MRRSNFHGFTLIEALLALAVICSGITLLWDGYLTHLKLQARLDGEVDALTDLAAVSEQLSLDADATTALPHATAAEVTLPTRDGLVRWNETAAGLERHAADGRARRWPSLHARALAIETVGARMIVLATVRGPGDADALLARAIPIGSAR